MRNYIVRYYVCEGAGYPTETRVKARDEREAVVRVLAGCLFLSDWEAYLRDETTKAQIHAKMRREIRKRFGRDWRVEQLIRREIWDPLVWFYDGSFQVCIRGVEKLETAACRRQTDRAIKSSENSGNLRRRRLPGSGLKID